MPAILLPASSSPGVNGYDGGGRLINAMAYPLGGAIKGAIAHRAAPGLSEVLATDSFVFRGALEVDGGFYLVQRNAAYHVSNSYVATRIGSIPGGGPVTLARNMRGSGPDVLCVHEYGVSILTPTSVSALTDADLPQPNSVAFLDGYFIFAIDDGRFFVSGINSTSVNALDFASAESAPDGLSRVIRKDDVVTLFGPQSIEWWANQRNPTGMPLGRITTRSGGIIGPWAVTGFEPGAPSDAPILFVGNDASINVMKGAQVQALDAPDVSRAVSRETDKAAIACASYVADGSLYQAVIMSGSTWVYDVARGTWHERESYGLTRWRVGGTFHAFGAWHAGDYQTGAVYRIDPLTWEEAGQPLISTIISAPGKDFPMRALRTSEAAFDFSLGLGRAPSEPETARNPQVRISYSLDGGRTFGNAVTRPLGQAGTWRGLVRLRPGGRFGPQGQIWKLEMSDPCPWSLMGGTMAVEGR